MNSNCLRPSIGLYTIVGAMALMGMQNSHANTAPALVTDCGVVTQPAAASTYYFSEDCTTGYVAAPTQGNVVLDGMITNANIGFCPSVDRARTQETTLQSSIDSIQLRVSTLDSNIDYTKLDLLRSAVADATADLELAQDGLLIAQGRLDGLRIDMLTARDEYSFCISDPLTIDPVIDCATQRQDYLDARTEYVNFRNDVFWPAETAVATASSDLRRAELQLAREESAIAALTAQLISLTNSLESLRDSAASVYDRYAAIAGASAKFLYTAGWTKLVNDFAAANPGMNVNWKRIPVTSVALHASVNDGFSGSGLHDIPVLLKASVPGLFDYGVQKFPDGTTALKPATTQGPQLSVPDSFSAGVVLSLLGVCPLEANPALKDNLGAYLIIDLNTNYEVMAHAGYSATYNLATFYSRFERVRNKRRFFRSSSVRTIIETRDANEEWNFSFTGDASFLGDTVAEQASAKLALEDEVRKRLYIHMLDNIGVRSSSANDVPATNVPPSAVGAYAAALRKTCATGGGYLCWGGWIIGGINSIWGGGSAATNFVQRNNSTVTDNVDFVFFKEEGGRTTFGSNNI